LRGRASRRVGPRGHGRGRRRLEGGAPMIRAEWFFWLVGAVFLVMAVQMAFDRTNPKRYTTAAFWGLLGAAFIYSTWVLTKKASPELLGAGVLVMAGLGGFGLTGRGRVDTTTREQRLASARRYGSRLFIPALP